MFNALQPTDITSQGSIACVSSINSNISRDKAIQETVEAAIVNQSEKITSGRSSSGFVFSIEARSRKYRPISMWISVVCYSGTNKAGKIVPSR